MVFFKTWITDLKLSLQTLMTLNLLNLLNLKYKAKLLENAEMASIRKWLMELMKIQQLLYL